MTPVEESLLYVQPLYLRAENGRIPELKRVIVAYQNQVVMAETLDGGRAGPQRQVAPPGAASAGRAPDCSAFRALIAELRRHCETSLEAQRQNNWTRYGEEIGQVGELLERLGTAVSGPP